MKLKRFLKRNNPFKMWGSYVGAGIGLFIHTFGKCQIVPKCEGFEWIKMGLAPFFLDFKGFFGGDDWIFYFGFIVFGFLIGYGLHLLLIKWRIVRK